MLPGGQVTLSCFLLQERIREAFLCEQVVVGQGVQESNEVTFLSLGKVHFFRLAARFQVCVEVRVALDARAIEINDRLERGETTIVHVGCRQGDVAERGDFEGAHLGIFAGNTTHAEVGWVGIEAVVGQLQYGAALVAAVARRTVGVV